MRQARPYPLADSEGIALTQLTTAEVELATRIEAAKDRGPGTVWGQTVEWLAGMLQVPSATVGAISIRGRGVIGNRLCTPGVIRSSPEIFLIASLEEDYTMSVLIERTVELVPKTRHLSTVLIAHKVPDPATPDAEVFRVTDAVAVDGVTKIDDIKAHFPGLTNIVRLPLTPLGSQKSAVGKRGWYVRHNLDQGAAAWFDRVPVGLAPGVGERVVFLAEGPTLDQVSPVAHGIVVESKLADSTSVDIKVAEIRRPTTITPVDLASLDAPTSDAPDGGTQ